MTSAGQPLSRMVITQSNAAVNSRLLPANICWGLAVDAEWGRQMNAAVRRQQQVSAAARKITSKLPRAPLRASQSLRCETLRLTT